MVYLFVLAMTSLALLFIAGKVFGDLVKWLIQKIVELREEIIANKTDNQGSA